MTEAPTTDHSDTTTPAQPDRWWRSRPRLGLGLGDDRGSATAEYAVVILAAVAFAGVLVTVMRSGEVQSILTELVRGALSL